MTGHEQLMAARDGGETGSGRPAAILRPRYSASRSSRARMRCSMFSGLLRCTMSRSSVMIGAPWKHGRDPTDDNELDAVFDQGPEQPFEIRRPIGHGEAS